MTILVLELLTCWHSCGTILWLPFPWFLTDFASGTRKSPRKSTAQREKSSLAAPPSCVCKVIEQEHSIRPRAKRQQSRATSSVWTLQEASGSVQRALTEAALSATGGGTRWPQLCFQVSALLRRWAPCSPASRPRPHPAMSSETVTAAVDHNRYVRRALGLQSLSEAIREARFRLLMVSFGTGQDAQDLTKSHGELHQQILASAQVAWRDTDTVPAS